MVCRADARKHENLRCVKSAGAQDHLAQGVRLLHPARYTIIDAGGTPPGEPYLKDLRARFYDEIWPSACPAEIGPRRRRATTIADRILSAAETFLLFGIIVRRIRKARRLPGLDPRAENRIRGLGELRPNRSVIATPLVFAAFPRFAFAKVRQNVLEGPTGRAISSPS